MNSAFQFQPGETVTADEYLRRERAAEWRSEFVNGRLYPRDGRGVAHNQITVALCWIFVTRLRGSNCQAFSSDLRLKASARDYVYPDFSVSCEPQFEDAECDSLVNPTLLIEVVPPFQEGPNESEKWLLYERLPSLRDYLVVSTDAVCVQHYTRLDKERWLYRTTRSINAEIALPSINCTLSLRDVYKRISFNPES